MHRRASSWYGAVIAPVGQASMQRRHVPQRSIAGSSGGRSSVVIISPSSSHEPIVLVDHAGVLADPPDARAGGQLFFHHRRGIDAAARLRIRRDRSRIQSASSCSRDLISS